MIEYDSESKNETTSKLQKSHKGEIKQLSQQFTKTKFLWVIQILTNRQQIKIGGKIETENFY